MCETKARAFAAEQRARKAKLKAEKAAAATGRPMSLVEENRRLFARQDETRRMRQGRRS
ncbi:hypothetical protein [Streptomyces anulatus]|uniref:hypothetical protein n=1 Tax=Streptomyces anulatus TaxID=1892 RepID=UPI003F49BA5F